MNEQHEIYGTVNLAIKHLKETYPLMNPSRQEAYIETLRIKIDMLESAACRQYLSSRLENKLRILKGGYNDRR